VVAVVLACDVCRLKFERKDRKKQFIRQMHRGTTGTQELIPPTVKGRLLSFSLNRNGGVIERWAEEAEEKLPLASRSLL